MVVVLIMLASVFSFPLSANGTYVISNGYARSVATWTVSYWSEANT